MAKLGKKRCAMCSGKLDPEKQVTDGENNYCDEYCKNWFHSTYDKEEISVEERVDNPKS